jgi:hypothetical protein
MPGRFFSHRHVLFIAFSLLQSFSIHIPISHILLTAQCRLPGTTNKDLVNILSPLEDIKDFL